MGFSPVLWAPLPINHLCSLVFAAEKTVRGLSPSFPSPTKERPQTGPGFGPPWAGPKSRERMAKRQLGREIKAA